MNWTQLSMTRLKRELSGIRLILLLKTVTISCWVLIVNFIADPALASGEYSEPTRPTNVNKQTDLFERSIEDFKGFEREIDGMRSRAGEDVGSGRGQEYLTDKSREEIEASSRSLSNINANELESKGRKQMIKENTLETLYFDESKPLSIAHKRDAERIAEASGKMLGNLLNALKQIGIDCKTVKGNKVVEPEYFIDIKKIETKEKIYNKTICEETRNKFDCSETLEVKCNRSSGRLDGNKTIRLKHTEMPDHWWIGRGNDGGQSFGYTTNLFIIFNTEAIGEVGQKIMEKTGNGNIVVSPQQIMIFGGKYVNYQLDAEGRAGSVQGVWQSEPEPISDSVRFFYRVSEEARCLEWKETRTTRCKLQ